MCRKWGLQPRMALWIYTAVIRPMILYAAFVWWTRTLQVTTQASLRKLQRLACLVVTGAMRSTPTVALEALLDLPPLHSQIQCEAMLAGSRLLKEERLLPGDFLGHLSICRRLYDLPKFNCPTDDMPAVVVLDNPINVDWTYQLVRTLGPLTSCRRKL